MKKNRIRDGICGGISTFIILCILAIFAVIFVVPLVQEWPYQVNFTLEHVMDVLNDWSLFGVYQNSLFVAFCTALLGLLVTYGAALATARSGLNGRLKGVIDGIALVTNTIPGMVITTKIKELQYYTKFNEVFVLSLFILGTNLIVKGVLGLIIRRKEGKKEN